MKQLKTAICCIACQENDYIHEWVDYYYKLGITHIYLYDNNKSFEANEKFDDVISDYIEKEFVTVIDKRDVVRDTFLSDCYNECYKNYNKDYDWFLFIDCDEFLWLKKFDNVNDFLLQDKFNDFHIIKINWLSYNDNGHIYKTEGLLQDRFPIPSDITDERIKWENRLLKSFVRGSLDTNYISIGIHTPVPVVNGNILAANISDPNYINIKRELESNLKWQYRACYADGEESFDLCYPNCFTPLEPKYDDAVFKHYRTKSCQEYVETKINRGFQDCSKKILNSGTYFYFNDYTKEKMDYFMSKGVEPPILLINSDTTDLGEMMCLYAAAKYAVKDIEHDYLIYWKNNNYLIVFEKIKNTKLFSDVEFFSSTLLLDIKHLRNCGEYHYIATEYPINKYIYKPLVVLPGRNITVNGPLVSYQYFDMEYIDKLFNLFDLNELVAQLYGTYFDLMNTAAILVNEYTKIEEITAMFMLYNNNVHYLIVTDDLEKAAAIVSVAYNDYYKQTNIDIQISWPVIPHSLLNHDIVKLYTFAVCRVSLIHMSDTVAWMGTMLNKVDHADILYSMDDNLIYNLMIPEKDSRFKNLRLF